MRDVAGGAALGGRRMENLAGKTRIRMAVAAQVRFGFAENPLLVGAMRVVTGGASIRAGVDDITVHPQGLRFVAGQAQRRFLLLQPERADQAVRLVAGGAFLFSQGLVRDLDVLADRLVAPGALRTLFEPVPLLELRLADSADDDNPDRNDQKRDDSSVVHDHELLSNWRNGSSISS
jgi:hypothetical protein